LFRTWCSGFPPSGAKRGAEPGKKNQGKRLGVLPGRFFYLDSSYATLGLNHWNNENMLAKNI
jgi:hypothetical protein